MFERQRRKFLKLCGAGGNVGRGMESVIELTCKVDVKYHSVGRRNQNVTGEEEKIEINEGNDQWVETSGQSAELSLSHCWKDDF